MHYSFKNTLNSMGTQVSATESIRLTHAQSVQFTKCSSPVQLITTIRNVYRLIDAPKTLSIFSENTPNESTNYKYNTLVHIERSDIRNER